MTVCICDLCAVGVVNDDWTALDYHYNEPEASAEYQRRTAAMESLGWLTPTGETRDGYGDCAICDEVVVDPRYFTTEGA